MTAIATAIHQTFAETPSTRTQQFPRPLVWAIVGICILPFLLSLLGVDFGSRSKPFDLSSASSMTEYEAIDAMFYRLSGAFAHTIFEWSAFCAAIFTVILAFTHYKITRDVATPVIGVALFCAGSMDAFHTLAAARLIEAVADNRDLIPFTWAICRVFNALIMIVGVSIFFVKKSEDSAGDLRFIVTISLAFGVVGYAIIHYAATSAALPQTMYPDSLITRPWDVVPLLLFVFAGLFLYPRFFRMHPSLFAHGLLISAIPEVVVELHMAFGSTALFDSHFNIAHFLKIIAYVVPFIGLALDYLRTYREEQLAMAKLQDSKTALAERQADLEELNVQLKREITERKQTQARLKKYTLELESSNRELQDFAHVASHDLQEPLRKVQMFGDRLMERCSDELSEQGQDYVARMHSATGRMQTLISDLLAFSRVTTKDQSLQPVDLAQIAKRVLADLETRIEQTGGTVDINDLPTIDADPTQMHQLLQNLIGNALKFHRPGQPPIVKVRGIILNGKDGNGVQDTDGQAVFELTVQDNGIGFEEKYRDRIFTIFQRLHGRSEYEGTGVGLAVCRKVAERHGGEISVNSVPGQGTTFVVTLPINHSARGEL